MRWIPVTKESESPVDQGGEYPEQFVLRCKNDGTRGDYEVFKVTAHEMWLTAKAFDFAEYLDESPSDEWIAVSKVKDTIAPFIKVARHVRNSPHPKIPIEALRTEATQAEMNAEYILGKDLYISISKDAFK